MCKLIQISGLTSLPSLHILCRNIRHLQSHKIVGKGEWAVSPFNPFPHTTISQQTTLNVFCQKIENLYNWMDNLYIWVKMENIVARFEQFLLCHYVFKKPSAAEASESVYIRERVNCHNVFKRSLTEIHLKLPAANLLYVKMG